MADFRKWFLAFAVVAFLLGMGSTANTSFATQCNLLGVVPGFSTVGDGGQLGNLAATQTLMNAEDSPPADVLFPNITGVDGQLTGVEIGTTADQTLADLPPKLELLCGVPLGAPGTSPPVSCLVVTGTFHDFVFINGTAQMASSLVDESHTIAVGTRWHTLLPIRRV